jgi:hypothetical protein
VARWPPGADLKAIEETVKRHPEGMTAQEISEALKSATPRRTLQYRLKSLVDDKRLVREGEGRRARYRGPRIAEAAGGTAGRAEARAEVEALLAERSSGTMSADPRRHASPSAMIAASLSHTGPMKVSISRPPSERACANSARPGSPNSLPAPMPDRF